MLETSVALSLGAKHRHVHSSIYPKSTAFVPLLPAARNGYYLEASRHIEYRPLRGRTEHVYPHQKQLSIHRHAQRCSWSTNSGSWHRQPGPHPRQLPSPTVAGASYGRPPTQFSLFAKVDSASCQHELMMAWKLIAPPGEKKKNFLRASLHGRQYIGDLLEG